MVNEKDIKAIYIKLYALLCRMEKAAEKKRF